MNPLRRSARALALGGLCLAAPALAQDAPAEASAPAPAPAENTPVPVEEATPEPEAAPEAAPEPAAKKKRRKPKNGAEARPKRRPGRLPMLHSRLGRRWMFLAPATARVGGGYAQDWFQRDAEGAFVEAAADIAPGVRYSRGRFLAALPLGLAHRETFGTALRQTDLSAGATTSLELGTAWELAADARFEQRWRPDWPDPYQPKLDADGQPGALRTTDRFGYTGWLAGLEGRWRPEPVTLTLRGEVARRVTPVDPAWDAVLNPTHLIPGDVSRWGLQLGARGTLLGDALRLRATVRYDDLTHPLADARDARTGLTHGGPGGDPPNPAQHDRRVGLETEWSAPWAAARTRFRLRGGVEHNQDTFDDYYTWTRWHAGAGATVRPWSTLAVSLDYDLRWRSYTRDGYTEGAGHPALDSGSVRADTEHQVGGEVSYGFWKRTLVPYVGGRWLRSETNFPDYAPYVFPAGVPYRLDWDRAALRVDAGVRARF